MDKKFHEVMAAASGVDESDAIAMMAAVVSGVAGPRNTLIEFAGPTRLAPLEMALVDDDGSGSDFFGRLLFAPRVSQEALVKRFHRLDEKLIKEVLVGKAGGQQHVDMLQKHTTAIFGPSSAFDMNEDRMIGEPDVLQKLDLVIRPRFLVESPTSRTLQESVTSLHMASGFLWGGSGFPVDDLTREDVGRFLGSIKGGRVPIPPILCGGRKGESQPTHVSWAMKTSLGAMTRNEVKALLKDALLLDVSPPSPKAMPSSEAALSAYHQWRRMIEVLLINRKEGEYFENAVETEEGSAEFEERYRSYRRECHEAGVVSQTVVQLPKLILCLPVLRGQHDRTHLSVEECFHHAEILCRRHQRLWLKANKRSEIESTVELAGRILEKIRKKNPLKLRDLLRGFDQQRKELYLPTLNLMLEAGLITESPAEVYHPGSVDEVEKALVPIVQSRHLRVVA